MDQSFSAKMGSEIIINPPPKYEYVKGFDGVIRRVPANSALFTSDGFGMSTSGVVVKMSEYESKVELLRKALEGFAGIHALMDRFGGTEPPVGTVIRWVKKFDARAGELIVEGASEMTVDGLGKALRFNVQAPSEYVFLAFRAPNGSWQTTSQRGASTRTWDQLLKEIDDSECWIASDWLDVPAPEKPTEEQLDPLAFAKKMFGKQDSASTE